LFIIQDKDQMSLIHYKHENPDNSFLRMWIHLSKNT
jgi:hypothetical protein